MREARLGGVTLLLLGALAACSAAQTEGTAPSADRWVLTGARVYAAPDEPPLDDAWVSVAGTRVDAVGRGSPPAGARRLAVCDGGVVVAGFQNSHVHLIDPVLTATGPREDVAAALADAFTRFGFTTIVDTGSDVANTVALRDRIESGDLSGPRILTVGWPLYPVNGLPVYLRDLPAELTDQLLQPATAAAAREDVRANFRRGAAGTKLFVATPQGGGVLKRMPADVARAAAEETHALGGLVMAHPTDARGVEDAVAAGADVLVHTTIDPPEPWGDGLIRDMVARGVAVVPTLKLWRYEMARAGAPAAAQEAASEGAAAQLRSYTAAGGRVLFGTDVGYMIDVDPTEEYTLMARAGTTPMQILSSLTDAPAARWREDGRRGRIEAGYDADLVVLERDPAADARAFAAVRCTIRGGRVLYVAR